MNIYIYIYIGILLVLSVYNMSNIANNTYMHTGSRSNTASNSDVKISSGGNSNGGNCVGNKILVVAVAII